MTYQGISWRLSCGLRYLQMHHTVIAARSAFVLRLRGSFPGRLVCYRHTFILFRGHELSDYRCRPLGSSYWLCFCWRSMDTLCIRETKVMGLLSPTQLHSQMMHKKRTQTSHFSDKELPQDKVRRQKRKSNRKPGDPVRISLVNQVIVGFRYNAPIKLMCFSRTAIHP